MEETHWLEEEAERLGYESVEDFLEEIVTRT